MVISRDGSAEQSEPLATRYGHAARMRFGERFHDCRDDLIQTMNTLLQLLFGLSLAP